MPLADLRAIYELLFRDGVMVAKKDNRPQCMHPNLEGIANLKVIRVMGSLKSRGFVRETFAWKHAYFYLTNEGIVYLREYLHLPPEIVPSSLQRVRRPAFTLDVMRRANRVGSQTVEGPTSYVPKPRGGVGESQEGMMDRQRYRHKRPGEEEEESSEKPPMRFRGSYQSRAPPGEAGAQTQTFFRRGQGPRRGEERVGEEGMRRGGFRSFENRNAAPVRESRPPTRVPVIPKEEALPEVQQVAEPTLPPAFIPAVEPTPEVPVEAPIIPEAPEEVPVTLDEVSEPALAPEVTPAEEPIAEVAPTEEIAEEEAPAVLETALAPDSTPADSEEPISEVPVETSSTPEIPADEAVSEVPVEAPSTPEVPEEVPQALSEVEPEVAPEVEPEVEPEAEPEAELEVSAPSVEEAVAEAVEEEVVQEVVSAEPPEVAEEPEPVEAVLEEEGAVTQVPSEELVQDVLEDGKEEEEGDEEDDDDEEATEEEPKPVLEEPAEVTDEIITEVKPDEPVEEESHPAPVVEEPKAEEQVVSEELVTEAVSAEITPDVPVEAEIDILEEPKELVDNELEAPVPAAKTETPELDSEEELPSPPSPVADDFTNVSEETGASHIAVCPETSSMQITQETVTVVEEPNVTQVVSQSHTSHTYVQMSSSSVMVSNMVPELGLEQEKAEAFEAHYASGPFVSSDSPISVLKSNLPHGDWGFLTEDPSEEQEVKKVWPDSMEG